MAIAIKSIPTLKDKVAEIFIKNAEASLTKKDSVNFSKQVKSANKILSKASI